MHQPRAHGRFGDLSEDDAAAAEALLRRVTNLKEQGGLDSLRMTWALPGGGNVTAMDTGGVVKTIVQRPPVHEDDATTEDWGKATVPMLFSGVVTEPMYRHGGKVEIRVSKETRRRLRGYPDKQRPPPAPPGGSAVPPPPPPPPPPAVPETLQLERFAVPIGPHFDEFQPKSPGIFVPSQYAQVRATWYSGAMAQVVQIVSGYGKRKFARKPNERLETVQMRLPESVRVKVEAELAGTVLPGYTGVPPASGQIQYDYKHGEHHAVAFGADKKPWLLRISAAGVYAMPLPLVPATTTKAFREWVKEMGDGELEWILDRFGGMPSGEPFPRTYLQDWERAGVVTKVCDTSDFFHYSAYASMCGWSFNTRGTEGYNTCWGYDDVEGLARGMLYSMTLRMGDLPTSKDLAGDKQTDNEGDAMHLGAYLGAMLQRASGDGEAGRAVKFKLHRASASELIERAKVSNEGSYDSEYQKWKDKKLAPIANHSGQVVQTKHGWLHHGASWDDQPQIKFPEPLVGYCVSFDFRPMMNGRSKNPKCDTPIFAYYMGDELKVVHYFKDPTPFERKVEDNFHECMTVGSWERREYAGQSTIQGHFYTSDWDDRKTFAEIETTTRIVGKDKGYDHTPWFSFDAPFWRPGTLWRNRYFTHETDVETEGGSGLVLGLCVPYRCRNALLYARKDYSRSNSHSHSVQLYHIRDPYSYRYWTADFLMHWAGTLEVMAGRPTPKDGSPVWVEIENYGPSQCSDFADNGSWISGLPADYTWLIHPQANVWYISGGGGMPSVDEYTETTPSTAKEETSLQVSLTARPQNLGKGDWVSHHYFTASPNRRDLEFYRDATHIAAGERQYGNVSEPPGAERRHHFGYTRFSDHTRAYCFIGVINE